MKRNPLSRSITLFGSVIACLIFVSQTALAKRAEYDIFTWQLENPPKWCMSILPTSKDPINVEAVKSSKDQLCGTRHDAKRLLGEAIDQGSRINWKVSEADGIVLPPRAAVNDLMRFADTMNYKLKLPKGHPQNTKSSGWE